MRYYFFGDIHGNTPALERCLEHIDARGPDAVHCLGDIVGWLPSGDETVKRMKALGLPTVAGNHDLMVGGLFRDHPHQLDRMQATAYNAGILAALPECVDYLLGLPLLLELEEFTVVHHSPFHLPPEGVAPDIGCFGYLDERLMREVLAKWRDYPKRLIFSGHDHDPAVYELPDAADPPRLEDVIAHRPPRTGSIAVRISQDARYWVKAGSVGGPYRDETPVANSVLYDDAAGVVELFRLEYPTGELRSRLASNRFFGGIPTIQSYLRVLDAATGPGA
ncbi:MAG: metallophosphoesterase [Syntrophobacteraceae bacterium]